MVVGLAVELWWWRLWELRMPLWRLGFLKALELRGKGLAELEERAKRMLASYTIV